MGDRMYDLYFTGKDDFRDCIIIGEDTRPVYIEFETPPGSERTTVRAFWRPVNRAPISLAMYSGLPE